ncbi:MAG: hypothetical protein K2X60_02720 [Xanthobacteraceae bacterium]|nr:hypothetical protein [Xanthobacteraceae bacterium]
MTPAHARDHSHSQDQHHGHHHSHEPDSPHPAQAMGWSILRMTLAARLAGAMGISAVMWAIVLLAMR